ncbi:MAG: cobyrinate a,c-diamide synthase [Parvibaculaceae bacterium]|nr:cobyrinate a,c-diamide synthase [Parvibaculaceae bacterium]
MTLLPAQPLALPPGLTIAAPRSGAGKTTVTLGLMRAFARAGLSVQPFKNGPDYIDPAFHTAATGRPSFNLDSWAMRESVLHALIARGEGCDIALAEGSMGLFDGAVRDGATGDGATADIAALAGWPVLLVLDVSGQAQSAAATALGCAMLRRDVSVAGVILNQVASERHDRLARQAIEKIGLPVLGAIRRQTLLALPERHLGLVQAGETAELESLLERLADEVSASCDLGSIRAAASSHRFADPAPAAPITPPAQRIAIARDTAFSFLYPHLAEGWRAAGAELLPFSPLADEAPDASADLVWLPGGYPELHGGRLAANLHFLDGLREAATRVPVHGECGGYMVLGSGLIDAGGTRHAMAGLLDLETDFSNRQFHLGYRSATLRADAAIGPEGRTFRGHEFHYARTLTTGSDVPLFDVEDAGGNRVAETGGRRGRVTGSFFHIID